MHQLACTAPHGTSLDLLACHLYFNIGLFENDGWRSGYDGGDPECSLVFLLHLELGFVLLWVRILYVLLYDILHYCWHLAHDICWQVPHSLGVTGVDFPCALGFPNGVDNNLALHEHLIGIIAKLMHIINLKQILLIIQQGKLQSLCPLNRLLVYIFGRLRCGLNNIAYNYYKPVLTDIRSSFRVWGVNARVPSCTWMCSSFSIFYVWSSIKL